jgi:imidazoleglycerol phosphate synthase glutamine amidotransferase subunit HisH
VYFANSYRLARGPDGWEGARTDHGGEFASALERGPLLACQFHPELSGAAGLTLIERWLSLAATKEPLTC